MTITQIANEVETEAGKIAAAYVTDEDIVIALSKESLTDIFQEPEEDDTLLMPKHGYVLDLAEALLVTNCPADMDITKADLANLASRIQKEVDSWGATPADYWQDIEDAEEDFSEERRTIYGNG